MKTGVSVFVSGVFTEGRTLFRRKKNYPNVFIFSLPKILIWDLTGKIVLSASTDSDKAEPNIQELAHGIYYLRVHSNNAVRIMKVVNNN